MHVQKMLLQEAILPRHYLWNNSDVLSSVFSEKLPPASVPLPNFSNNLHWDWQNSETESTETNKLVLKMEGREKIRLHQSFLLVLLKTFGGVRVWTYFLGFFLTWFCSNCPLVTSFTFQGNPAFVLFYDCISCDSTGISSHLQLFIATSFQWLFSSTVLNLNWNLWQKQYLFKPLSFFFLLFNANFDSIITALGNHSA